MPVEKKFGLKVGQELDIIKGKHDGHTGYMTSFTEKMVVVQVVISGGNNFSSHLFSRQLMGCGEIKFEIGDKMKIQCECIFLHGHPPSQWPHTDMEGKVAVVTKVTPNFVTIKVDGKLMKKSKVKCSAFVDVIILNYIDI